MQCIRVIAGCKASESTWDSNHYKAYTLVLTAELIRILMQPLHIALFSCNTCIILVYQHIASYIINSWYYKL